MVAGTVWRVCYQCGREWRCVRALLDVMGLSLLSAPRTSIQIAHRRAAPCPSVAREGRGAENSSSVSTAGSVCAWWDMQASQSQHRSWSGLCVIALACVQ